MGQQYVIYNGAMPTTAPFTKQPTGTGTRTQLQIATSSGNPIWIHEWGISFDAATAATPIQCELVDTNVAATMSTAHVASGIMSWDYVSDGGVSTVSIGTTSLTGFATAAVTEGTVTATRLLDYEQVPPTGLYVKAWPLGEYPIVVGSKFLRVRTTAGTSVNCTIWVRYHD